ncbi:MAG: ABC transporter, partial [Comamonadaceae bacterium]
LVIATHDQRVVQALAGAQQLDLNETAAYRALDGRNQL